MAETPSLSTIDSLLENTRLIVEWLPEVAALWDGWGEDAQADFTLEWMGLMTNLTAVTDAVIAGQATPRQVTSYRRLQEKLRAAAPLLARLELHVRPELLRPFPARVPA